jgi:hypothetical protein
MGADPATSPIVRVLRCCANCTIPISSPLRSLTSSQHCNDAGLARDHVGRALARCGYGGWFQVAEQVVPLETVDVYALRKSYGHGEQLSLL